MSDVLTGNAANVTTLTATITSLSNNGSGAVRVTTAAPHLFGPSDTILVSTAVLTGAFTIAVINTNTFDLVGSTYTATSTGTATDVSLTPQVLVPTDGDTASLQLSGMLSSFQALLDRTQALEVKCGSMGLAGYGVLGTNATSYGVASGIGVLGVGAGGVATTRTAPTGVAGTGGSAGGNGVSGEGTGNFSGVLGIGSGGVVVSWNGVGVHGVGATVGTGDGVHGLGTGSGAGVSAQGGSSNGCGVSAIGAGNAAGVIAAGGSTNGSIGVVATSNATNGQGGLFTATGTGSGLLGQGASNTTPITTQGTGVVGIGAGNTGYPVAPLNDCGVIGLGGPGFPGVVGYGCTTGAGGAFTGGGSGAVGVVATGSGTSAGITCTAGTAGHSAIIAANGPLAMGGANGGVGPAPNSLYPDNICKCHGRVQTGQGTGSPLILPSSFGTFAAVYADSSTIKITMLNAMSNGVNYTVTHSCAVPPSSTSNTYPVRVDKIDASNFEFKIVAANVGWNSYATPLDSNQWTVDFDVFGPQ